MFLILVFCNVVTTFLVVFSLSCCFGCILVSPILGSVVTVGLVGFFDLASGSVDGFCDATIVEAPVFLVVLTEGRTVVLLDVVLTAFF